MQLTPLLGVGGGEVEAEIPAVTNTFAPTNTHTLVCKKLLETFIFFKRAGPKSIKCWPGLQAGLAEAAWVAELYENQMGSSLGLGQPLSLQPNQTANWKQFISLPPFTEHSPTQPAE